MVAIKKRAVNPAQKALRREQILAAGAELFASHRYEAVNMVLLAGVAGITKPALYRYFRSKEALFLALFRQELAKLSLGFSLLGRPENLGPAVAAQFARLPLYCRLSAILHTVLERDLTYEEALDFKLILKAEIGVIGGFLAAAMEITDEALLLDKMLQTQQALIGVWHMTHPVGAVAEVLKRPDMINFCQDFEETLAKHLTAILRP